MVNYRNVVFEQDNKIGYVTLNRPEESNAVNRAMAEELAICCQAINQNEEIRVVVLTGSGRTFSWSSREIDYHDPLAAGIASMAIASLKMPVIAAINGDALGSGLELALACDIRVAVDGIQLGLPETSYGCIPAGGGTQRLPRIVGRGKALELILTGAIIGAEEAQHIGLVNRVVLPQELSQEVAKLANKLTSKGPIAERYAKEAINKGLDMTLAQGLRLEADLSFLLQSTKDRDEGIHAFMEKRPPVFKGE